MAGGNTAVYGRLLRIGVLLAALLWSLRGDGLARAEVTDLECAKSRLDAFVGNTPVRFYDLYVPEPTPSGRSFILVLRRNGTVIRTFGAGTHNFEDAGPKGVTYSYEFVLEDNAGIREGFWACTATLGHVAGTLRSDMTWDNSSGDWELWSNVYIDEGVSLTINNATVTSGNTPYNVYALVSVGSGPQGIRLTIQNSTLKRVSIHDGTNDRSLPGLTLVATNSRFEEGYARAKSIPVFENNTGMGYRSSAFAMAAQGQTLLYRGNQLDGGLSLQFTQSPLNLFVEENDLDEFAMGGSGGARFTGTAIISNNKFVTITVEDATGKVAITDNLVKGGGIVVSTTAPTAMGDVIVARNELQNPGIQIGFWSSVGPVAGTAAKIVVEQNTIACTSLDQGEASIRVHSATQINIINNTISGCRHGIAFRGNVSLSTVAGNTMKLTTSHGQLWAVGLQFMASDAFAEIIEKNTIKDNVFELPTLRAISVLLLSSGPKGQIRDNLIYNNRFGGSRAGPGPESWGNVRIAMECQNCPNKWSLDGKAAGPNIVGGPFLGGNFWSDYTGADADGDGIGDTPRAMYRMAGSAVVDTELVVVTERTLDPTN